MCNKIPYCNCNILDHLDIKEIENRKGNTIKKIYPRTNELKILYINKDISNLDLWYPGKQSTPLDYLWENELNENGENYDVCCFPIHNKNIKMKVRKCLLCGREYHINSHNQYFCQFCFKIRRCDNEDCQKLFLMNAYRFFLRIEDFLNEESTNKEYKNGQGNEFLLNLLKIQEKIKSNNIIINNEDYNYLNSFNFNSNFNSNFNFNLNKIFCSQSCSSKSAGKQSSKNNYLDYCDVCKKITIHTLNGSCKRCVGNENLQSESMQKWIHSEECNKIRRKNGEKWNNSEKGKEFHSKVLKDYNKTEAGKKNTQNNLKKIHLDMSNGKGANSKENIEKKIKDPNGKFGKGIVKCFCDICNINTYHIGNRCLTCNPIENTGGSYKPIYFCKTCGKDAPHDLNGKCLVCSGEYVWCGHCQKFETKIRNEQKEHWIYYKSRTKNG